MRFEDLTGDEVTVPAQDRGWGDREDFRPAAASTSRRNAASQSGAFPPLGTQIPDGSDERAEFYRNLIADR